MEINAAEFRANCFKILDQIIVATARIHNLTLLTKDRNILDYGHVNALW